MELKHTISAMKSVDYDERFKAEYWQTKIRYEKLHKTVIKAEAGTLDFKPKCDIELLKRQKRCMGEYLYTLELRAEIEGIELGYIRYETEEECCEDNSVKIGFANE